MLLPIPFPIASVISSIVYACVLLELRKSKSIFFCSVLYSAIVLSNLRIILKYYTRKKLFCQEFLLTEGQKYDIILLKKILGDIL